MVDGPQVGIPVPVDELERVWYRKGARSWRGMAHRGALGLLRDLEHLRLGRTFDATLLRHLNQQQPRVRGEVRAEGGGNLVEGDRRQQRLQQRAFLFGRLRLLALGHGAVHLADELVCVARRRLAHGVLGPGEQGLLRIHELLFVEAVLARAFGFLQQAVE